MQSIKKLYISQDLWVSHSMNLFSSNYYTIREPFDAGTDPPVQPSEILCIMMIGKSKNTNSLHLMLYSNAKMVAPWN